MRTPQSWRKLTLLATLLALTGCKNKMKFCGDVAETATCPPAESVRLPQNLTPNCSPPDLLVSVDGGPVETAVQEPNVCSGQGPRLKGCCYDVTADNDRGFFDSPSCNDMFICPPRLDEPASP